MTLTEALEHIKQKYPQQEIELEGFDFETQKNRIINHPKYFFRGESKIYFKTETTYSRLIKEKRFSQAQWQEIVFSTSLLYLFLRGALWEISNNDHTNHNANVEIYIVGLLQHYGFDTSFIDLSSDLDVIASFASASEVETDGRILILPGKIISEICYDLTKCDAERPKRQHAYALWDQFNNLNIKDKKFLKAYNAEWLEFTLDESDKVLNKPDFYYSIKNDHIAKNIIDWFENSDIKTKIFDEEVKNYLTEKVNILKQYSA